MEFLNKKNSKTPTKTLAQICEEGAKWAREMERKNPNYFKEHELSRNDILKGAGVHLPNKITALTKIPNAKQVLKSTFDYVIGFENKETVWLPEYDKVVEWLENDKGKGLILAGNGGRGKTLLTNYILPIILYEHRNLVLKIHTMKQMFDNVDKILNTRIPIVLDDIGTEDVMNDFGTNREVFAEIIDQAEKTRRLVLISTNLNYQQLAQRYGGRVMERIKATVRGIAFNGESLRG